MSEIYTWNNAAASNNAASPDGFPENMNYSQVNNSARELMAAWAKQMRDQSGEIVTTGTGSALVVTPYRTHSANAETDHFGFKTHVNVASGATLQIGTAPAVPLVDREGTAIVSETVLSDEIVFVNYDTTLSSWKLLGIKNSYTPANRVLTGTILPYLNASVPLGYIPCNGAAVSRTFYSELFAILGTSWGVGDGSTTFNVPNLQGQTLAGVGGTSTSVLGNALTNQGGTRGHALTESEIPAHTHTASASTHNHDVINVSSAGGHVHSSDANIGTIKQGTSDFEAPLLLTPFNATRYFDNLGHKHSAVFSEVTATITENTSQTWDVEHSNIQPCLVVNYCIKT